MIGPAEPLKRKYWKYLGEGSWVVAGQLTAFLFGLLGVRILTGILGPESYGRLALGMTMTALTNQVIFGPLGAGAARFYAASIEQKDLDGFWAAIGRFRRRSLLFLLAGTLGIAVVLAAIGQETDIPYLFAVALLSMLSGVQGVFTSVLGAARKRRSVAAFQSADALLRVVGAYAFLTIGGASSSLAIAGFAFSSAVVITLQNRLMPKIFGTPSAESSGVKSDWLAQIWEYIWPLALSGVLSWGFHASQRWALEVFSTTKDVGYFAAVSQVGYTPIIMAGGAFSSLLVPILFQRSGDGSDPERAAATIRVVKQVAVGAATIVAFATIAGFALHKELFELLVAKDFWHVSHYLPYSILAAGIYQISLILSQALLVRRRTRDFLGLNTIGNGTVALASFFLASWHGLNGIFVALVFGSTLHLLWMLLLLRRASVERGPREQGPAT